MDIKIWDKIKEKITIPDVHGSLDRQGRGECLDGNTASPSFQYYNKSETFSCFNCGRHGDVIELYQWKKGLPDRSTAITELAKELGIPMNHEDATVIETKRTISTIFGDFLVKCHANLKINKTLWDREKKKRGFTDKAMEHFQIGLFDENIKSRMENAYNHAQLKAAGFLGNTEKEGWIVGTRLVYPYLDRNDKPIYFIYRRIDDKPDFRIDKKGNCHKYVKQQTTDFVENPLFGLNSLHDRNKDVLIITEGITDAMSVIQAGYPCLSPVTTQFKERDVDLIARWCKGFDKIVIVNDDDKNKSGENGAAKTVKFLLSRGINACIGFLPNPEDKDGFDMNDYLGSAHDDAERTALLDDLVSQAKDGFTYLVESIPENYTDDDIMEVLECVPDGDISKRKWLAKQLKKKPFEITIKEFEKLEARIKENREKDAEDDTVPEKKPLDTSDRVIKLDQPIISSENIYAWTIAFEQEELFTEPMEVNGKTVTIEKAVKVKKLLVNVHRLENGKFVEYRHIHNVNMKNEIQVIRVRGLDGIIFTWETRWFQAIDGLAEILELNPISIDQLRETFLTIIERLVKMENDADYIFLFYEILHDLIYTISDQTFIHVIYGGTGSGKSTLAKILAKLDFFSYIVANPSNAATFRLADMGRVLVIDEFDKLAPENSKDKEFADFLTTIRIGFERGASIPRCEGENNAVRGFNTYSPKILASEHVIPPNLESARNRMINTCMMTSMVSLEKLSFYNAELHKARNLLMAFMLRNFSRYCYLSNAFRDLWNGNAPKNVPSELAGNIKNLLEYMSQYKQLKDRIQDMARTMILVASWSKVDLDAIHDFFVEQQKATASKSIEDNEEYDFLRCLDDMRAGKVTDFTCKVKKDKEFVDHTVKAENIYQNINDTLKFYLGNNLFRLLKQNYHEFEYKTFAAHVHEILSKYSIPILKETKPGGKLTLEIPVSNIGNAIKAKRRAMGIDAESDEKSEDTEFEDFDADEVLKGPKFSPEHETINVDVNTGSIYDRVSRAIHEIPNWEQLPDGEICRRLGDVFLAASERTRFQDVINGERNALRKQESKNKAS